MLSLPQVAHNLKVCGRCRRESGAVLTTMGKPECPQDGAPCMDHAKSGQCAKKLLVGGPGSLVRGVVGIAKAVAGIDRASPEMIASREAICRGCDKAVMVAGIFRKCSICKCATAAKIRNAGEKCPLGKW